MAIQEGPSTHNERALKTKYPVVEGLTAGTTKQTGERYLRVRGKKLTTRNENVGLS